MINIRFLYLRTAIAGLMILLTTFAAADDTEARNGGLAPDPFYGVIAKKIAAALPAKHLLREPLDNTISERAWTNYLSSLDYEHVYFTHQDIERFTAKRDQLDDMLKVGDISFAYDVFNTFMERLNERIEYAKKLLADGFDLDKREFYKFRDNKSAWPRDDAERDELWRKKIKNEYIRQVIAEEQAKAAMTNDTAAVTNAAGVVVSNSVVVSSSSAEVAVSGQAGTGTAVTNAAVTSSDTNTSAHVVIKPEKLTPAEKVLKRYTQMQVVLRDNDADWVMEKYLSAFTHAYDPHSDYMSDNASEDFDIEMSLSLVGIGALLRSEDGMVKIVRLIPGGPAKRDKSKNRLKPGDRIIAVAQGDGEPVDVRHRPLSKVVRLIRGKKGTTVKLTVIPVTDPSGMSTKIVTLVRDEVKLEQQAASSKVRTVKGADGIEHKIGVIKLPAFYASMNVRSFNDPRFRSASYDVYKEIEKLRKDKVEGIILDLRNNGGGALMEAIKMVGLFIQTGAVVMVQERRSLHVLPDNDPSIAYTGPLLVLDNRLSASASEIVTAALQDYGRAIVMGDSHTHGKGTVQTVLPLGFDKRLGKIKITTAGYYRISGKSTQLCGVTPDIRMSSGYDFMNLGEDKLPNPVKCMPIEPALYTPVADLSSIIPVLRQKSHARLVGNERYKVYQKLLDRIDKLYTNKEISLNIEERRKIAASDRELSELQEKLLPSDESYGADDSGQDDEDSKDGDKDSKKKPADIVLDEALNVMCDYMKYDAATVKIKPVSVRVSWPDIIESMLKNL